MYADVLDDDTDSSVYGPGSLNTARHEAYIKEDDDDDDGETLVVDARPSPIAPRPAAKRPKTTSKPAKPRAKTGRKKPAPRAVAPRAARKSAPSVSAAGTVFLNDDNDEDGFSQPPPVNAPRKFVVGIDYGTTFSSVAYVSHAIGDKTPRFTSKEVKNIVGSPEARTVFCYCPATLVTCLHCICHPPTLHLLTRTCHSDQLA